MLNESLWREPKATTTQSKQARKGPLTLDIYCLSEIHIIHKGPLPPVHTNHFRGPLPNNRPHRPFSKGGGPAGLGGGSGSGGIAYNPPSTGDRP